MPQHNAVLKVMHIHNITKTHDYSAETFRTLPEEVTMNPHKVNQTIGHIITYSKIRCQECLNHPEEAPVIPKAFIWTIG